MDSKENSEVLSFKTQLFQALKDHLRIKVRRHGEHDVQVSLFFDDELIDEADAYLGEIDYD